MLQPAFQEKAIQLVHVTAQGKYEIHAEAAEFLRHVPKPISVISVAGLYRTGKSYLLNRILLNRNNGFGVGPTINPCTKGLWCWGVPLKGTTDSGQKINILIVDSEGIGALDEDQNHDMKIFTLAILSSSIFIYNSVGSIDENALQNLSLVVNLTKSIQLNANNQVDQDPEELARYFPTFFWVVRDFALQLVSSEGETITPKDYLERALAPQKGFSDDVQEKNRIRRLLTTYFKERECSTLVRPLVNQQKLQHLYDCSFDDLRPEFVEQALNLRKKVLTNAKPKMLKGEHLDGTMYFSMLNSYVNAINNGSIPNIENAWTYMCIQKCMRLQEQCYGFLGEEMNNLRENFPCPSAEFDSAIEEIQTECLRMFEAEQIGEESKEYLCQLKSKIKERTCGARLENEKESIEMLKKYILKNFSVIEKKMKMNEYASFQDFLKSINSFYQYLLENGPDLPKREIVYQDFLKKVTSQGAEIFLKQASQNLQSLRGMSQQKEKVLRLENDSLKSSLGGELQRCKQALQSAYLQKSQREKQLRETEQKLQELKVWSSGELSKMQSGYQNKMKVLQIKLGQLSISLDELKQKKTSLESLNTIEKKEREKERAVTELKLNQYREELKTLKVKDKTQEIQINQVSSQYSSKIRELSLQHERKINQAATQLTLVRDRLSETQQAKQTVEKRLEALQKNASAMTRKYQEQLRSQIDKFDTYKAQFQSEKLLKLEALEVENDQLKTTVELLQTAKSQSERSVKQAGDRTKNLTCEYEKELAIAKQKLQFLVHEQNQSRESYNKNIAYYESLLKNKNDVEQEEVVKAYKDKMREAEHVAAMRVRQLENQLASLKEKYSGEVSNSLKLEEQLKYEAEMDAKRYGSELATKNKQIQTLQDERKRLYLERSKEIQSLQVEFRSRETSLQGKIRELQSELEAVFEKASEQQSEFSNKSQESLRQLKNYYQLEKEKLQQKIVMQKQKFEKKLQKLRDQSDVQLEEERRVAEEEYENLRDEYINETTIMKGTIDHLQHENDTLAKSLDTLEKRCQEEKDRLEKKQLEFSSKLESLMKAGSQEKEAMQNKFFEANELRSQAEKELISATHQRQQLAKQLKELSGRYEGKVEELFYVNKNLQRIGNDNRQKYNELNNEYMNQRLNYEKKIALCDQEKEFYAKKLEEAEREHGKNSLLWEERMRKIKADHSEEVKEMENRKNADYALLEGKYDKLKKIAKDNEQQTTRTLNDLEKQLAIEQEKYSNLSERFRELQDKKSTDGDQLYEQLTSTKHELSRVKKESGEQIQRLKRDLSELQAERNQLQSLSERDKILMENKTSFLEEIKEKNKREYLEKIRTLEATLETVQKNRMAEKNQYDSLSNDNIAKLQKKYTAALQESHESWCKKEKEYEGTVKRLQNELRGLTEKMALQVQAKAEAIKANERRIKELQQSQKRALGELQKYKSSKQSLNSQNVSSLQKEREVMKQKIQERQEKYKNLEKTKQQLYYDSQKQKARWNLQKENYSMRNDELKEVIAKHERDLEKLQRENEKLKAEKKCGKMSVGYSRYSFEKANNSKYSIEDSIGSISMSISKESSNPLGEMNFFNNQ